MKNQVKELKKIRLKELNPCQNDLKKISFKNTTKLINSMKKNGFSAPFFVWYNEEIEKYDILDGHQRYFCLKQLEKEEGVVFDPVPCVIIEAEDKLSARKTLLSLSSQFGEHQVIGFENFLEENEINIQEIDFSFPEIKEFKEKEREVYEARNVTAERSQQDLEFNLIITFKTEDEQREFFEEMKQKNLNIRML